MLKRLFLLFIFFWMFVACSCLANADTASRVLSLPTPSLFLHSLPSRADFIGQVGDASSVEVDVMLPLQGRPDAMFFLDGGGRYGEHDAWFGSIGGGIRDIEGDYLLGAYAFFDHNVIPLDRQYFSVLNPGFEILNNRWDFHLNGYFLLTSEQKHIGIVPGGCAGVDVFGAVAPGFDIIVGRSFLPHNNLRVYAGFYNYIFRDAKNIVGVQGGIEYRINRHITLAVEDSQDNVSSNSIAGKLILTLGGLYESERPDVRERMLFPIKRHLGSLHTGAGIPHQRLFVKRPCLPEPAALGNGNMVASPGTPPNGAANNQQLTTMRSSSSISGDLGSKNLRVYRCHRIGYHTGCAQILPSPSLLRDFYSLRPFLVGSSTHGATYEHHFAQDPYFFYKFEFY